MHTSAFAAYHPAIVFGFFICAVVFCVLGFHPIFQAVGLLCALSYYLCIRGWSGLKVVLGLIPVFIVLALVNPLFNPQGETVLFTWWGGRPYTLQALLFGISTSAMFVTVLLWFFSYNRVMTSDRFTYLFGGFAPAITLVFTMVLRLVPTYQRKATDIIGARDCIGHAASHGSIRQRVKAGTSLLSALTSWALEGAIIAADSMRSRGYGTGKRTSFAKYRWTLRAKVIGIVMAALALAALAIMLGGLEPVEYFPALIIPPWTALSWVGFGAYTLFLALPTLIDLQEALSWRISLSNI